MKRIDLNKLTRPNILKMKPYSSARDDFKGNGSVFLDANENPFAKLYNRYPDPYQQKLKDKIALIKKVNTNQLFLGNGSDEAIDLLIRAFCIPGVDNVVIPQPTYGMYSVSAETNDIQIRNVILTTEFDVDVQATLNAVDTNSKIIFLCSPNNPSGNLLSADKIKTILDSFNGLLVVDEAYIDFTDQLSFTSLLPHYQNLVILQTLSKAWGLAALRLGMCFGNEAVINILNKIKPPYNINEATQHLALKQLNLLTQKELWVKKIIKQRGELIAALNKLKMVNKIFPSDANFVLVKVNNAQQTYQRLVQKGIIVRDRSKVVLCEECLRISVGTEQENKTLLKALEQL
jgi:histidinol-phosphate aminotransferase